MEFDQSLTNLNILLKDYCLGEFYFLIGLIAKIPERLFDKHWVEE